MKMSTDAAPPPAKSRVTVNANKLVAVFPSARASLSGVIEKVALSFSQTRSIFTILKGISPYVVNMNTLENN